MKENSTINHKRIGYEFQFLLTIASAMPLLAADSPPVDRTADGMVLGPLNDVLKVWTFADGFGLKTSGAVKLGVACGGDGTVAEFNGGCLETEPGVRRVSGNR